MSNYKTFDIDKARELRIVYKKKRHYAKEELVGSLITRQRINKNSIVGIYISLNHIYKKKTIQTVLDDLGYKLTFYKTANIEKYTLFSFEPKNCDSAEG